MKTELEIVPDVINPGRKIQVHNKKMRNYHLHRICKAIMKLVYGMMESDSANSNSLNSARETRNFWKGFNEIKVEYDNAKRFRDQPPATHEYQHDLLVPTPNEMASISNSKVERCVAELYRLVAICLGADSNKMQSWTSDGELGEFQECINACEYIMSLYLGTGNGSTDTKFDTGIDLPEYAYGRLVPDIDLDSTSIYEPSSEQPNIAGTVDNLPSTAPAPKL